MIAPLIETSWDDGSASDIRLAVLLKTYNLPATFYIPGNCELEDHQIKVLADDFEIGVHTTTHPRDLKLLDKWELRYEIGENRLWLERLLKRKINKFCYPRGRYNDAVVHELENMGFESARTTELGCIEKPQIKLRSGTTLHAYPRPEYEPLGGLVAAAQYYLDQARLKGDNGYFHFWGHGWEIDKFDLWEEVEDVFKLLAK